jgi:hypothetical protein
MNCQGDCTSFSAADVLAMEPMVKVGLLATVNDEGLPHLTLLSSLQANTPTQLIFGQFTEGLSKQHVRNNPKVGFLVMTLDREIWRGKATFTHVARQGPEFDMYNNTAMFRYNAYFGIHTVYYMDLVEHVGKQVLPTSRVAIAAVQTLIARALSGKLASGDGLNLWTRELMNKLGNLKFLSYIGADGYPVIVPIIQAQAANAGTILFASAAYKHDLEVIPQAATAAVFCMSLDMEAVLVRGEFQGLRRVGCFRCGSVQVSWVYNPMPPKPQQIYLQPAFAPVTAFQAEPGTTAT